MNILLIGATGQLGHALARALAKTHYQLSVLVRNKRKLALPQDVRVIEAPTFTSQAMRQAMVAVDHVIYGVGRPEQFVFDKTVFERVNYDLLQTFLRVFKETGLKDLTYISTYEVFQVVHGIIRETHPVADERYVTSYSQSMVRAYRLVSAFAQEQGIHLTTIHPAALYGGRNTGYGVTNYLENLFRKRHWNLPFIFDGRFPVVHVNSLAAAIIRSVKHTGAYIVSDQMTDLKDIADVTRKHSDFYVPRITAPIQAVRAGVVMLELAARLTRAVPIMSRVQVDFIRQGWEPKPDKACRELDWKPLPLEEGVKQYVHGKGPDGAG